MRKRMPRIWIHYQQITGNWEWDIGNGNLYVGGYGFPERYRTEYDALDGAREAWRQYFPTLEEPDPQYFRTAHEYAHAVVTDERGRRG